MTETEACIALNMIPKMGPVRLRNLLQVFGSPERILRAKGSELREVEGIGKDVVTEITRWEETIDLQEELEHVERFGAHVITGSSPEYPKLLKEIHNPPIVLYVWGKIEERDQHALGVVGSRRTSHYGQECARKLSFQLSHAGLCVVSGLARGIDTAAHTGALAAKGRTIAVIGSGLCELYPPENKQLAERIADGNGAVVSEFPMTTTPDVQTFPMRNRIISGWGFGVLVVEAGVRSGALISASQAAEQGRSVYAVPGPIDRPTSIGTNRLIQNGAKLVMDADDILEDMQTLFSVAPTAPELFAPTVQVQLTPEQQSVYDAIEPSETPMDRIVAKCGLPTARVSSTLLALEMKRLVKQLPGNHFVKLV